MRVICTAYDRTNTPKITSDALDPNARVENGLAVTVSTASKSIYAMYLVVPPSGCRVERRQHRHSRQAWLCRFERSQDSLRQSRDRPADRHDPRLSGLLVHLARPDGGFIGYLPVRSHRSAR